MASYDTQLRARLLELGGKLRDERAIKGISQEELANVSGLHRTYVGAIERGERNITIASLFAIADALEVPASGLLPE